MCGEVARDPVDLGVHEPEPVVRHLDLVREESREHRRGDARAFEEQGEYLPRRIRLDVRDRCVPGNARSGPARPTALAPCSTVAFTMFQPAAEENCHPGSG